VSGLGLGLGWWRGKKQRKVVFRRVWKEEKDDRELASSPHDTDDLPVAWPWPISQ
jgi:hypothetical protein